MLVLTKFLMQILHNPDSSRLTHKSACYEYLGNMAILVTPQY